MKPYTDLDQSKQLAEILPIDTADGYYEAQINPKTEEWEVVLIPGNQWPSLEVVVPCWTLAALLEVLPDRIDDRYDLVLGKLSANDGWYVCYEDNDLLFQHYHFHKHYVDNNNLFDACVEMITILHKENEL